MSGGSQHNPNGRQSQLGAGWSPLQLQMANLLARAPQAHMASERGVTWHTPTPPPHLYHVPAPDPPAIDPLQGLSTLQAMKGAANSVFRHTATPPELYRHTPTPPDKHLMRCVCVISNVSLATLGLSTLQVMKGAANSVFRHTATPPELYRHTPTPPDKHLMRCVCVISNVSLATLGLSTLQVMKGAANSVFRHTATPPELYRHTPTPPDKHLMRCVCVISNVSLATLGLSTLQVMKGAANSVFRHTATPPELYRHTPTPPDKHLMRCVCVISNVSLATLGLSTLQAMKGAANSVFRHTPTPPDKHLMRGVCVISNVSRATLGLSTLQAMKGAANSVFRHTATPPELYRHTPTPPDKHLMRHTPSPGDVKASAALPPAELYPHLGPGRDKLMRPDDLLSYARGGVDLTVGGPRGANGSPAPMHPTPGAPALSVRDAPTINSLIARAAPHARPAHARVDALLERLSAAPTPGSPHSVIVHSRAAPTPSPPSSNEDSADSCGAPPGSKRKRKPERTIRVPVPPPLIPPPPEAPKPPTPTRVSPHTTQPLLENGVTAYETQNGPEKPPSPPPEPHARRKTRSGSAETIDDIAAMIASTTDHRDATIETAPAPEPETPVTVDKLKSVLASPVPEPKSPIPLKPENSPQPEPGQKSPKQNSPKKTPPQNSPPQKSPPKNDEPEPPPEAAAAPRRRSARNSNAESTNVPVESPSEGKPAEPEASEVSEARTAEPTAASFVEVENQLEKMFAGIAEENPAGTEQEEKSTSVKKQTAKARKRRKSAPTKGERKASKRANRSSTGDEGPRRKAARKKVVEKKKKETVVPQAPVKDAYDSGSNASSGRSRGPYIQIVGPRDSPVSVSVVNATAGAADEERRTGDEWRNGLRARGLHASTLGLRYDASTPDASWLCAFCERGPHYAGLGDLFGPYQLDTNCDEYSSLDEASKQRFASSSGGAEVWFHEACGVWAPGLLAAGSRVWGLASAVCGARAARCGGCGRAGAALSCATRACRAATHVPCATTWTLKDDFRALCPRHA